MADVLNQVSGDRAGAPAGCTCPPPKRECPRCSHACLACAKLRGTAATCEHLEGAWPGGLCFPCWEAISFPPEAVAANYGATS